MRIVAATDQDVDVAVQIYLSARAAAQMPPGIHPPDDVRRHVRDDLLPHAEVWLAGVPADGLLVLAGGELDWLFVRPAAQGRGVGSALLEHAKLRSPGGLQLWVFEQNVAATRFYLRHGFVVTGRTDGDNEEGAPDLRLRWRPATAGPTPPPATAGPTPPPATAGPTPPPATAGP